MQEKRKKPRRKLPRSGALRSISEAFLLFADGIRFLPILFAESAELEDT